MSELLPSKKYVDLGRKFAHEQIKTIAGQAAVYLFAAWLDERAQGETSDDSHAFKNFHRVLCERFGYAHDEKDWRRDQVSLIEWIAKRPGSVDGEAQFERMLADTHVPNEPLEVYTSNSFHRVGLRRTYREVLCATCDRSDGHPNFSNYALLDALVCAFNAMLARRAVKTPAEPGP